MVKVGLTGGICTGKSRVLDIFRDFNAYTLKSDEIARNILFHDDSPVLKDLSAVFGTDIVNPESGIDKEKFTRVLFEDARKREAVNRKVLPLITRERNTTFNELKKNSNYHFFVYESALLVESGTYRDFDKIIVVYTTPEEQLKRLMKRDGIGREEAGQKIKSQYPLSEKLKVAHYTVDTTGSLEMTRRKTLETIYLLKRHCNLE